MPTCTRAERYNYCSDVDWTVVAVAGGADDGDGDYLRYYCDVDTLMCPDGMMIGFGAAAAVDSMRQRRWRWNFVAVDDTSVVWHIQLLETGV